MKHLSRSQRNWFVALFSGYSAVGILLFISGYFDDRSRGIWGTAPRRATEEMAGAYTALAFLPFVIWFARRYRIRLSNWRKTVPLTVFAGIVYSIAHTTLNALVRDFVSIVTFQGVYDYGSMIYRYPMEAAKDVIYFFIFIGCVTFIDTLSQKRKAELDTAELQTKLAEAKLQNLRLQLHPHFLFNTLNAISSVMYEDVQKADEMLSKLSDFLRVVLASSGVHEVPLEEELSVERMYVDIMTTRLERRLSLNIHVAEEARAATVPFMLLQPLLENSIRHGMGAERDAIDLGVDVRRENGSTLICVSDDGVGFDPKAGAGIGLSNVASRLEHMYGPSASFKIESRAEGGTLATVRLPFMKGEA